MCFFFLIPKNDCTFAQLYCGSSSIATGCLSYLIAGFELYPPKPLQVFCVQHTDHTENSTKGGKITVLAINYTALLSFYTNQHLWQKFILYSQMKLKSIWLENITIFSNCTHEDWSVFWIELAATIYFICLGPGVYSIIMSRNPVTGVQV